jgi:hypothetical protein
MKPTEVPRRRPLGRKAPSTDHTEATLTQSTDIEWRPPGYFVGLDGKIYPGVGLHSKRIREYLFGRCYYEHHDNRLSDRQIVAALAEEGWRVSVGTVAAYLKQECVKCSGGPNVIT